MKQYISSIAGIFSIAALFLVAIMGVINGVEPITCSYRAICGAVFVYCMMTIALRIVARIVLTAMVDSKISEDENAEEQ
ncbi:MAG: hypothetical protein FVQ82_01315 [Planctomycetes bacterium]|nr:hypothetical protein [Planctomycetota bacterium]